MIRTDFEWWAALPPSGFEVDQRIVMRGRGFPLIRGDMARCTDPECWRGDGEEHAHEVLSLPAMGVGSASTVGAGSASVHPGHYYVSVVSGGSSRLLRGPFTWHHEALAAVDGARREAQERDPRAAWYAFGTCRTPFDAGPGLLDAKGGES